MKSYNLSYLLLFFLVGGGGVGIFVIHNIS